MKHTIPGDAFEARISGIPCIVEVISYKNAVFNVRDRKGYLAPWLERKMSSNDKWAISCEIEARSWDR